MPMLAAWLGTLFGGLWTAIQAYLVAKLLLRVAAVGLLYAAWSSLKGIVDGVLSALVTSAPAIVAVPLTWVIPPQFPAILSTVLTVEAGLLAYRWTKILFGVRLAS